jgi:transposase
MGKIEISINLPEINVLKVEEDKFQNILIYVETTEIFTHCRLCGKKITKRHGHDRERKLRHLSAFGKHTYIIYQPHRYVCENCDNNPTTTATPNWHSANSAYTKDYENHVLLELVNSTLADVCMKEKLSEESVLGILNRLIETQVDWSAIDYLGIIGMDEIALKKGYKDYVTIISSRVAGKLRLLAVLNGRKKAAIKDFLKRIPKRLKKTVEAICVDLYEGYINAAKEVFKQTMIIVIDRYHVAKLYRGELDKFRQKILRQLKQELPGRAYEKLKGATLILRRNNEYIRPEEKAILNELFSYSPELMEAYRLALKLTQLFNTHLSKQEALIELDEWIRLVKRSELTCFNKFIATLKKWKNEIANYFIDRNSGGFVEGLNNKVKVLKRRCYGIFNVKHLFQRLYLDISGYDILLEKIAF